MRYMTVEAGVSPKIVTAVLKRISTFIGAVTVKVKVLPATLALPPSTGGARENKLIRPVSSVTSIVIELSGVAEKKEV